MDSTPVNWEALDSLVLDFARSENLIEDQSSPSSSSSPPPSPTSSSPSSSSSYKSRLVIRRIRCAVEGGDVDAAVALLRAHAPEVLDDHRLLFRLQKQKFIELLRKGTLEDRDAAIQCLRRALAPVALDAYPEAYEEFKHVILALVYPKEDVNSPVADEWSLKKRSDIAGLLTSVLRSHLHAHDPIFAMTLRYLISIHKVFCFRQGIPSPISDLTQRLLFEDRDPPAVPVESLYEAPPFDEVDIQALAHAVELTRQGAIDSLRFAKGNLFDAFQNELCRINVNTTVLDELVFEYCVYRGLVDTVRNSTSECMSSKLSDGEPSIGNIEVERDQAFDFFSNHPNEAETRASHEACSTSDTNQTESNSRKFRRNRSRTIVECSRRKRWRGRVQNCSHDQFIENCSEEPHSSLVSLGNTEDDQGSSRSSLEHVDDCKYEIILELKELANKGMANEVVEELNDIEPDFFTKHPVLLFQLKQVEFLKLVSVGNYETALKVASSYLGPLATSNPNLLKPLKETLLALLGPSEVTLTGGTPLSVLATSLQVAMCGTLGIEEPKLMKIIRETLHSHSEWFKLQMCKDRFEGFLRIDCLKQIDASITSNSKSKVVGDTCNTQSQQSSVDSSGFLTNNNSPAQLTAGEVGLDENAIIKVMEFLALPRADAIHLLGQYNGNAEAVIQQMFA